MKNNNVIGIIFGVIIGFLFVITCTTPLSSESKKTEGTSSSGKYQIETHLIAGSSGYYYTETIFDTENGEVISRKYDYMTYLRDFFTEF